MPIATARLIQMDLLCKRFGYRYIRKCYLTVAGNRTLSELIECAKKSVKFPSTSFSFRAGDMCSEDAKEFLTLMGSSIKTLTLIAVDNATLCSKMNLTTILSQTPNLETLIFEGGSYYDSKVTHQLMLPSLKSIQIAGQLNTPLGLELILNGAPNLENIAGIWRLDDLEPIVITDKIHTIKCWCPSKFPFSSGLVRLATATEDKLKLSELVLADEHQYSSNRVDTELLWKCFHEILSTNTIQKLIVNPTEYPVNATFPLNMDNVKELVLMPSYKPIGRHFPLNINFNSTFPHIRTLSFYDPLYHKCCACTDWENSFPLSDEFKDFNQILSTVTTLNLRKESTSIRMLRKMKKMCPNVENLEICLGKKSDTKKVFHELCGEWRQLKTLSIDMKQREVESLDSLFTGLSRKYGDSLNADQSLTEQEKLRKAEDTRIVLWIGNISGKQKKFYLFFRLSFSYFSF